MTTSDTIFILIGISMLVGLMPVILYPFFHKKERNNSQ